MRSKTRLPTTLLVSLLLSACDKSATPAESVVDPSPAVDSVSETVAAVENSAALAPFDDAEVFFELNTTANDMGLQVFLDAEGWQRVSVTDPNGNRLFRLLVDGKLSQIGITELRFESAEPAPNQVRSRFPPGTYIFRGQTVEGDALVSRATLSHSLLPAPTFTPRNGQLVDRFNTVVRWNAPDAEQVEVIIEQDDLGHVFDVTVSGSTNRLTIPPQFLRPGREYKIEILAIGENGNRTIAESTFRTRL